MTVSIVEKWDRRISWSLMYYYFANAVNYTVKSVFPISSSLWNLISLVIGISIGIVLLGSIRQVYKRSSKIFIDSYVIFGALYLISTLMIMFRGEPTNLIREIAISTFAFYIPVGTYAVSVCNKKILYDVMLKGSNVLFALMTFRILANYGLVNTVKEELEYSMSFGYILIVPTLFHYNEGFQKRKTTYMVLFILDVFGILLFASRGVLLSIFAFVLYKTFVSARSASTKVLYAMFFLVVYVLISSYGDVMLNRTIVALDNRGVSSRTLNMIEANAIDDDSGRNYLYKVSYEMILEKPFFGWGLGGEYYHFAERLNQPDANTACSSHNGVLQAMVQFGVIGGLLASLFIIIPIFGLKKIKDSYLKDIITIYFCAYAIPSVTISSGFFVQPQIAIYLYLYYFSKKQLKIHSLPNRIS